MSKTQPNHANVRAQTAPVAYPASDGYVAIITSNEKHWEALVDALGLHSLAAQPSFRTRSDRTRNMDQLDATISAITITYSRDDLIRKLREHRAPCAPVQELEDVVNDPHLMERGGTSSH